MHHSLLHLQPNVLPKNGVEARVLDVKWLFQHCLENVGKEYASIETRAEFDVFAVGHYFILLTRRSTFVR